MNLISMNENIKKPDWFRGNVINPIKVKSKNIEYLASYNSEYIYDLRKISEVVKLSLMVEYVTGNVDCDNGVLLIHHKQGFYIKIYDINKNIEPILILENRNMQVAGLTTYMIMNNNITTKEQIETEILLIKNITELKSNKVDNYAIAVLCPEKVNKVVLGCEFSILEKGEIKDCLISSNDYLPQSENYLVNYYNEKIRLLRKDIIVAVKNYKELENIDNLIVTLPDIQNAINNGYQLDLVNYINAGSNDLYYIGDLSNDKKSLLLNNIQSNGFEFELLSTHQSTIVIYSKDIKVILNSQNNKSICINETEVCNSIYKIEKQDIELTDTEVCFGYDLDMVTIINSILSNSIKTIYNIKNPNSINVYEMMNKCDYMIYNIISGKLPKIHNKSCQEPYVYAILSNELYKQKLMICKDTKNYIDVTEDNAVTTKYINYSNKLYNVSTLYINTLVSLCRNISNAERHMNYLLYEDIILSEQKPIKRVFVRKILNDNISMILNISNPFNITSSEDADIINIEIVKETNNGMVSIINDKNSTANDGILCFEDVIYIENLENRVILRVDNWDSSTNKLHNYLKKFKACLFGNYLLMLNNMKLQDKINFMIVGIQVYRNNNIANEFKKSLLTIGNNHKTEFEIVGEYKNKFLEMVVPLDTYTINHALDKIDYNNKFDNNYTIEKRIIL